MWTPSNLASSTYQSGIIERATCMEIDEFPLSHIPWLQNEPRVALLAQGRQMVMGQKLFPWVDNGMIVMILMIVDDDDGFVHAWYFGKRSMFRLRNNEQNNKSYLQNNLVRTKNVQCSPVTLHRWGHPQPGTKSLYRWCKPRQCECRPVIKPKTVGYATSFTLLQHSFPTFFSLLSLPPSKELLSSHHPSDLVAPRVSIPLHSTTMNGWWIIIIHLCETTTHNNCLETAMICQ